MRQEISRTSTKFDTPSALKQIGMSLDTATKAEVLYKHPFSGKILPMPDRFSTAIYNIDTEDIASVNSSDYTLVQHRPITDAYTEILQAFNLDAFGTVHNYGDRMYIETAFGKRDIVDGVKLGVRIKNSYDTMSSFALQAFGYRTACSNGMFLGQVMKKDVSVSMKHIGDINVKETITSFIRDLISSENQLQEYISIAMKDSIEWSVVSNFLDGLLNKKQAFIMKLAIDDKLKGSPVTRWQLYNAFTWFATHQLISDLAQDKMQSIAQKVLMNPIEVMIK
jgi:hypothetical protein